MGCKCYFCAYLNIIEPNKFKCPHCNIIYSWKIPGNWKKPEIMKVEKKK